MPRNQVQPESWAPRPARSVLRTLLYASGILTILIIITLTIVLPLVLVQKTVKPIMTTTIVMTTSHIRTTKDPDSSIESSAPYDATLQDPSTSTIVTETLPESTTTATSLASSITSSITTKLMETPSSSSDDLIYSSSSFTPTSTSTPTTTTNDSISFDTTRVPCEQPITTVSISTSTIMDSTVDPQVTSITDETTEGIQTTTESDDLAEYHTTILNTENSVEIFQSSPDNLLPISTTQSNSEASESTGMSSYATENSDIPIQTTSLHMIQPTTIYISNSSTSPSVPVEMSTHLHDIDESTKTSIEDTQLPFSTLNGCQATLSSPPLTSQNVISSTTSSDGTPSFSTELNDSSNNVQNTVVSTTIRTTTVTEKISPRNLLTNPSATDRLNGWRQVYSSPVIEDEGNRLNSGYGPRTNPYCFAGGPGPGSKSALIQRIRIINGTQRFTESEIDSGRLIANISFYYQTWYFFFQSYDLVDLTLSFANTTTTFAKFTTERLACPNGPSWCKYESRIRVPNGTRFIDYEMTFYQEGLLGTQIDAYTDDHWLSIS